MSDHDSDPLVLLCELENLSDAHLVGVSLEEAGIAFRVAEHGSHGFDVAFPHAWGMLYVDAAERARAEAIVAAVRADEALEEGELDGGDED
ncbi:MAG: hypothetical protein H6744_04770 [Deltaproteobacteria bacterium]|nr:hypothetical protein [Deltaproteobacteria bacterium]MCB9785989.1 hypothetical protein [Deltaproteobacteria bacterium]